MTANDPREPFLPPITRDNYAVVNAPAIARPTVDRKQKMLRVSTAPTPAGEYARALALAGLKWTPDKLPYKRKVDRPLQDAFETLRIRAKLDALGIVNDAGKYRLETCRNLATINSETPIEYARLLIDAHGTDDFSKLARAWEEMVDATPYLNPGLRELPYYADAYASGTVRPHFLDRPDIPRAYSKLFHDWIVDLIENPPPPPPGNPGSESGDDSGEIDPNALEEISAESGADIFESDIEEYEEYEADGERKSAEFNYEMLGADWAEMTIETADLTRTLPPKLYSRQFRHAPEGMFPRYMHRLYTDGEIYAERSRRKGGGAVLIDISGSMSLTAEQVEEIMHDLSCDVIAVYAGSGNTGTMRIVARKGRMAERHEFSLPFGGNCIDGPALHWLSMQPGPRVWVSDGMVTGRRETFDWKLRANVGRFIVRHSIIRVDSAEELIGKLKRL